MDESFKQRLVECGADVESTVRRFMGNEAMYEKFLKKFTDNSNYSGLEESIAAGDYEEAFKCAHTLKGVSANLGLDPIYKASSDLTEEVRGKQNEEVNKERVQEIWQELQRVYKVFEDLIGTL